MRPSTIHPQTVLLQRSSVEAGGESGVAVCVFVPVVNGPISHHHHHHHRWWSHHPVEKIQPQSRRYRRRNNSFQPGTGEVVPYDGGKLFHAPQLSRGHAVLHKTQWPGKGWQDTTTIASGYPHPTLRGTTYRGGGVSRLPANPAGRTSVTSQEE